MSVSEDFLMLDDLHPIDIVEDIAALPQTIMDVARDGDVVLTMGAGSIGAVPGKVAEQK